jgi:hypothetical protein
VLGETVEIAALIEIISYGGKIGLIRFYDCAKNPHRRAKGIASVKNGSENPISAD